MDGQVYSRCKCLVDRFIVLKHIFNNVVRFVDRVPLAIVVGVLDFYREGDSFLGIISNSFQ